MNRDIRFTWRKDSTPTHTLWRMPFTLAKTVTFLIRKKASTNTASTTDDSDIEMPRSKYLCQNRGIRAGFFKKNIEYPCLHYKSYPCNQSTHTAYQSAVP